MKKQTSNLPLVNGNGAGKLHRRRKGGMALRATIFGLAATVALAGRSTGATLTATENVADYGTYSQLNSGVTYLNPDNVGPNACAPTSAANTLTYLSNVSGISGLVQGGYTTINTLAQDMNTSSSAGTSDGDAVSGLNTYLQAQGVASEVSVDDISNPEPLDLYTWLTAGEAVAVGFDWSGGGGHWFSLYSITIDTDNDTGTMEFIDPYGEPAGPTATGANITNAIFAVVGGTFNFSYSGGAAGNDGDVDNPADSPGGFIDIAYGISAVPEPATWALIGFGSLAIAGANWKRRRVAETGQAV